MAAWRNIQDISAHCLSNFRTVLMLFAIGFACNLFSNINAQLIPTSIGYLDGKPVMQRNGENVLFAGIQYWGLDSWNLGNWDNDLEEIKLMGFNGLRLNIGWDHIETADGIFDFTLLDKLLDKVDSAELMVYLQFNQSAHNWKPAWFTDKYSKSDLVALDVNGNKQYSRFSYSSPFFKDHYTRYITNTIEHVKMRKCIVAYSVYTEPHFADKEQWMDYNTHNIEAFRDWLEKRYTDISALNSAWNTSFSSFSTLIPYDKTPPQNWENLSGTEKKMFGEWRLWNCIAKSKLISGVIASARTVDPDHLYGQNMMWKWSGDHAATALLDPEINYEYADIIGINVYPYSHRYQKIGDNVSFIMSLHNYSKVVWLGEFNNKQGNASESDLRLFTDECFKAGGTGFVYFTYNSNTGDGTNINKYGVVLDGKRKESWYSLQSYFNNSFKGKENEILSTPIPVPKVNFLWTELNKFITYLDGNYCLDTYNSLRAWLYHDNQIDIGVISEKRFIEGDFDKALPLVVPSTPFTSTETAEKIKQYVQEQGMTAFISGRFGEYIFGENTGCKYYGYPRMDQTIEIGLQSLIKGECDDKISVTDQFYDLTVSDTDIQPVIEKISITATLGMNVIARWNGTNDAALITKPLGRGHIMYYGTHLFGSEGDMNRDFYGRLMKSFVQWAEYVTPPIISSSQNTDLSGRVSFLYTAINDHLTIDSDSQSQLFLNIINVDGQILISRKLQEGGGSLSLSEFTPGIYFVSVSNNNYQQSFKIMKGR